VPATLHWLAPVPPTAPHVPFWFVPVFMQLPVQHWVFSKQMSPVCVQNETAPEHTPPWQRPEQQSVLREQPLPDVRQPPPGLTAAHLPLVQTPLQQSVPAMQFPATGLSGTHALEVQVWLEPQNPEQQSLGCAHEAPTAPHVPPDAPHTLGVGTPQTPPFGQVAPPPHRIKPPQPSGTKPHVRPVHALAALAGWHCTFPPHTLGTPPPPQTWGALHPPQFAVSPPHPSATWPQFLPNWAHVLGVHVPPSGPAIVPPPHTLG
jgi:hypothetical protein